MEPEIKTIEDLYLWFPLLDPKNPFNTARRREGGRMEKWYQCPNCGFQETEALIKAVKESRSLPSLFLCRGDCGGVLNHYGPLTRPTFPIDYMGNQVHEDRIARIEEKIKTVQVTVEQLLQEYGMTST